MPYLNTDDGFPDHPKVDALTDGAFRLHVAGMHYCAKNTTDGLIPVGRVDRLKPGFKAGQLQELLDGRLWHLGGKGCGTDECIKGKAGHYVVHDYLQWNQSAEWWGARRAAEAKRKAEYRRRMAEKGSK